MGNHFKILEGIVKQASIRHGIILSNIANSDTPGYRAKDIKFADELKKATLKLKITHFKHIRGNHLETSGQVVFEPTKPWLDKNNVELDLEMAKLVENALLFQAGINMLSIKIRMFKNALRR